MQAHEYKDASRYCGDSALKFRSLRALLVGGTSGSGVILLSLH